MKTKWIKILLAAVLGAVLLVSALVNTVFFDTAESVNILGHTLFVTQSDKMDAGTPGTAIKKNSLVLGKPYTGGELTDGGTVICYYTVNGTKHTTVSKVIEAEEDGSGYRVSWLKAQEGSFVQIAGTDIIAVSTYHSAEIGSAIVWITSVPGLIVTVILPGVLLLTVVLTMRKGRKSRHSEDLDDFGGDEDSEEYDFLNDPFYGDDGDEYDFGLELDLDPEPEPEKPAKQPKQKKEKSAKKTKKPDTSEQLSAKRRSGPQIPPGAGQRHQLTPESPQVRQTWSQPPLVRPAPEYQLDPFGNGRAGNTGKGNPPLFVPKPNTGIPGAPGNSGNKLKSIPNAANAAKPAGIPPQPLRPRRSAPPPPIQKKNAPLSGEDYLNMYKPTAASPANVNPLHDGYSMNPARTRDVKQVMQDTATKEIQTRRSVSAPPPVPKPTKTTVIKSSGTRQPSRTPSGFDELINMIDSQKNKLK